MSTDDDNTPPLGRAKRLQSQTERDTEGFAAKQRREARDLSGVVAAFVEEDITNNYSGEDLQRMREARPTPMRFRHLEDRVDGVVKTIGEWRAESATELSAARTEFTKGLSDVTAGLATLGGDVRGLTTIVKERHERDHVTFKAQVEVDTAKAEGQIEVDTAKAKDQIDAKKAQRAWVTKALTIIAGAITLASGAFAAGRC